MDREAVLRAIARGWCARPNVFKEMDSDLATAICDEIMALREQAAQPVAASSVCTMCGVDTPHGHNVNQVIEWLRTQARRFLPPGTKPGAICILPISETETPLCWMVRARSTDTVVAITDKHQAEQYTDTLYYIVPLYASAPAPSGTVPDVAVRLALMTLLNHAHVEPGWENCEAVVQAWLAAAPVAGRKEGE